MSKQSNQKLKLLYLKDYLERETDEQHPTTVKRIIGYLNSLGISCERKTVYDDIGELKKYGMDIISTRDRCNSYFVGERRFQPIELRLLMDAVSSARFLTPKKTAELQDKLLTLSCSHDREWIGSPMPDSESMKSPNEQIYLALSTLHKAAVQGTLITFKYWKYNAKKQKEYKKDGGLYTVAPYLITMNDGNYYLIGQDTEESRLKTFRVDKMEQVRNTAAPSPECPDKKILSGFVKSRFSIYDGESTGITLRFDSALTGLMMDKFGKDVPVISGKDGTATLNVQVKTSVWFYSWLVGLGSDVEIVSPEEVRQGYTEHLRSILDIYGTSSV